MNREKLTVQSAAIRDHDGTIYSIEKPARHHDVIRFMVSEGVKTPITGEQGFLLSNGQFARRVAAKRIARNAGQLLDRASPSKELFSEDVW